MAQQANASTVRRQLRFTITLANPRVEALHDQVVWLYAPASRGTTQWLERLAVSMEHQVLADALGHNIVKLAFPRVAPLSSKVVTLVADVQLDETPAVESLADRRAWLATERFVETDAPAIRKLAAELRRPAERDTAREIYDWVRKHLQYAGYIADDLGALHALTHRRGDCTEYAYLAVALARANGIPARMLGGFTADRNLAPRADEYHNWAELYFDSAWRLLDAQKEHWLTPIQHYVAFRICRDEVTNPIGISHRYRVQGELEVGL